MAKEFAAIVEKLRDACLAKTVAKDDILVPSGSVIIADVFKDAVSNEIGTMHDGYTDDADNVPKNNAVVERVFQVIASVGDAVMIVGIARTSLSQKRCNHRYVVVRRYC